MKEIKPKKFKYHRKGEKERRCTFCGRMGGLIRKYDLLVCRRCFREKAEALGFKKYD